MVANSPAVLALDVGHKRIGVARTIPGVRLAQPLTTLAAEQALPDIRRIVHEQHADTLVVGLPRGLDGQDTAQTAYVRQFVADLQSNLDCTFVWQDEALTSRKAEDELRRRGKPYQPGDVDALAATFILEDYLQDNGAGHV